NTEVFIGNRDDILCCSCASGPAFEGAHIKHGMRAVTGAIESVSIEPGSFDVEYTTIGDARPVGLCGSAMVDVVAEMLRCGLIDGRGRLNADVETPRLRRTGGSVEFVLAWGDETGTGREIVVTQKDIDEIQLAKAAIFTGCSILMRRKGVERDDLDRVLIAGAFGRYLDPRSAMVIGLVPDVPVEKMAFVGNTAITGAKMALVSREAREAASVIAREARYVELTLDADFAREFANAMYLPHRDLERFPSVRRLLERRR
ncbi:TPA: DUF4445 domain-containing protein, partial [Candidatus Bathyarchaeota archaeon]|nr:DUF4445 domain-containing protein [Candidatus Bathyarchaeota archaeon]